MRGAAKDVSEAMQRRANDRVWREPDRVADYATRTLRPVEVVILARYRDLLSGRVLELGSGAGRVTGYLAEIAASVHGLDLSPAMVAYARARYPRATFAEGNLRHLDDLPSGSWDAAVAAYNVIDVLDDADRNRALDQVFRLIVPGGSLVMSSHNRAVADRVHQALRLRGRSPRATASALLRLPRRVRNRRRLAPFERDEPGYAIRNDVAHDFGVLHYYITRDAQEAQLAAHGFELLACLDLDGRDVEAGAVSDSSELHYVARRAE